MPHDGSPDSQATAPLFQKLEKRFPADYRWIRRAIHEVEDALSDAGLSSESIGSIAIVLAEALNNVVEHAFKDGQEGKITLVIRARHKSLMFEIRDSGRPMPLGRAPSGAHPVDEHDRLDSIPEGGFGWFLIRELVQDLVYDRRDGENLLLFRFRLDR